MSRPHGTVDEGRIDAYLDGELSPETRLEVERAAQADPALDARLRLDRAIGESLHRAFDPVLDDPVPARLLSAIGPRPWPWWRRAAAAAAFAALGAAAGWHAARLDEASRVAAARPVSVEAVAAHAVYLPEVRHPVEVDSSQRTHLDAWLSKRLAHELSAPDLRALGFHLVGGRLLPDAGRPAAQYMYETGDGERITVYVRGEPRARSPTALRFAEDRGFRVVFWEDDGMSYAVTGRLDRTRMESIATVAHEQL